MYFVYFHDGYDDEGFESFETKEEVVSFVNERISNNSDGARTINDYRVIQGIELSLEVEDVIQKVQLTQVR